MLTEKVLFCLVVLPVLWTAYGVVLLTLTDLDRPTIALIMTSMPVFAYVGIVVSDAGMVDMKDLRPYFMRLFPSARKRLAVLPETRRQLQADLRAFIKSIGTSSFPISRLWTHLPLMSDSSLCSLLDPRTRTGRHLLLQRAPGLEDDPREVIPVGQAGGQDRLNETRKAGAGTVRQ
jgi:hypothetical protein